MQINVNAKSLTAVALCTGAALYMSSAFAGELSPPNGAPSPTMTTLGEIGSAVRGDAVQYESDKSGPMAISQATAETQGDITGDDTVGGMPDVMEIYGFSHEIDAPRDAASGLPAGKRQHKPVTVTKELDKASPLLMNVLVNFENMPTVKFVFTAQDPRLPSSGYWTVELENASVSNIRHDTIGVGADGMPLVREHVSFTYQKIIWTWEDGGITAEDDWETPVAR